MTYAKFQFKLSVALLNNLNYIIFLLFDYLGVFKSRHFNTSILNKKYVVLNGEAAPYN